MNLSATDASPTPAHVPSVGAARAYPLTFVGVGLAAEAVLLLLRAALLDGADGIDGFAVARALGAELSRDGFSYGYLAVAIVVGLGLLGRLLGKREDSLRETSVTDSLTHVINRRGFDQALAREVARAREAKMPLALLVLDIDHFKRLNDELGHQAGDLALQRLGEVLRATCRSRDVPGRLGGDEFVVILPRTTADEAEVLAERIRDTLATHPFTSAWRAGLDRRFELSIGVASLDDVGAPTPAALIEAADRALYQAKADGRNRVARSLPSLRLATPFAAAAACAPPSPKCPGDANDEEERLYNLGSESCANSNSSPPMRTPLSFETPFRAQAVSSVDSVRSDSRGVDSRVDVSPAGATTLRARS